ncbi:MAG: M1 family metallopeptidase [Bacteroidetes bacterium]|nr:M1 family metallopeptidase [Bacteroidota bacterium]
MKVKKKSLPLIILSTIFIVFAAAILLNIKWFGQRYSMIIGAAGMYNFAYEDRINSKNIDVLSYDMNIKLYPAEKYIEGEVCIHMVINNKTQENISLDFYDNMEILDFTVNQKKAEYNRTGNKLIIHADESFGDSVKVQVSYKGKPESHGFGSFEFSDDDSSQIIYTLNEPVYASTWFPCNDYPDDKVNAKITIENDSQFVSVSNGALKNISGNGNRKSYTWQTEYPISTFLISIYSAPYKNFTQHYITENGDTTLLDYYVTAEKLNDAKRDFADHTMYLEVFTRLFGEYPFKNEKYAVAEIGWTGGAIEHQTITGIGSNFISGHKFYSDILIHELAHQWWGNAVGIKTWADIWLSEGFSTYSEALYYESVSGFDALKSTMLSNYDEFESTELYAPDEFIFSKIVYDKGAWVLHMLRKEIGDKLFFETLRNYYDTYKYKNASTKDFQNLVELTSGKDLQYFFDQWVYNGKGIIEVEFDWKYNSAKAQLSLQLLQKQKGWKKYSFPIDVKLKYPYNDRDLTFSINSIDTTLIIDSEEKPDTIVFDSDAWLLAKYLRKEKN